MKLGKTVADESPAPTRPLPAEAVSPLSASSPGSIQEMPARSVLLPVQRCPARDVYGSRRSRPARGELGLAEEPLDKCEVRHKSAAASAETSACRRRDPSPSLMGEDTLLRRVTCRRVWVGRAHLCAHGAARSLLAGTADRGGRGRQPVGNAGAGGGLHPRQRDGRNRDRTRARTVVTARFSISGSFPT